MRRIFGIYGCFSFGNISQHKYWSIFVTHWTLRKNDACVTKRKTPYNVQWTEINYVEFRFSIYVYDVIWSVRGLSFCEDRWDHFPFFFVLELLEKSFSISCIFLRTLCCTICCAFILQSHGISWSLWDSDIQESTEKSWIYVSVCDRLGCLVLLVDADDSSIIVQ